MISLFFYRFLNYFLITRSQIRYGLIKFQLILKINISIIGNKEKISYEQEDKPLMNPLFSSMRYQRIFGAGLPMAKHFSTTSPCSITAKLFSDVRDSMKFGDSLNFNLEKNI